ncbi:hypothetical protein ABKV19_012152 [Rosa sericea]
MKRRFCPCFISVARHLSTVSELPRLPSRHLVCCSVLSCLRYEGGGTVCWPLRFGFDLPCVNLEVSINTERAEEGDRIVGIITGRDCFLFGLDKSSAVGCVDCERDIVCCGISDFRLGGSMQRRLSIVFLPLLLYLLFAIGFVFYCYSDYQLSHDREIKRLVVFPAVLEKKGQEEKFNPKFGVKIRLITSFRDTCYIEILPKYRNAT